MEQNAPVESGIASFLDKFGQRFANGADAQRKLTDKEVFDKYAKEHPQAKTLAVDPNTGKVPPKIAKGGGANQEDKNFMVTFRQAQAKVNAAIQHYSDTHSNIMTNPTGFQEWQSKSPQDKNNEIADAFENGELKGLKGQHDFIYNPDNMARFSKLNGIGGNAPKAPEAGTAEDLMNVPQPAPAIPGAGSALPPQAQPPQPMQNRPQPQMAQAPMAQPKPPMQPPPQMAQMKMPPVGNIPVGPQSAPNTMIPGQGPANSQNEEELDNTPTA